MTRLSTWLVALILLVILLGAGLANDAGDVLVLLPILVLLVPLLFGHYVGESAIEKLAVLFERGRISSWTQGTSVFPPRVTPMVDVFIAGSLGSRGPPLPGA